MEAKKVVLILSNSKDRYTSRQNHVKNYIAMYFICRCEILSLIPGSDWSCKRLAAHNVRIIVESDHKINYLAIIVGELCERSTVTSHLILRLQESRSGIVVVSHILL